MSDRLLAPDEPPAFTETRRSGLSAFVLTVDHASSRIPRRLAGLGLPTGELERHIAWDIGALAVAERVASALDAPLVASDYSRLLIDCNRDPRVAASIPAGSKFTANPGNSALSDVERAPRRAAMFDAYHAHLRAMHAAVLYNRDRRFARLVLDALRGEPGLPIGDNKPYFVSDQTDYTIAQHGERRGLPQVEIEMRQDLIFGAAGQDEWARRITRALQAAECSFSRAQP